MSSAPNAFVCPGCDRENTAACVGAIAIFNGERHTYMLCPRCSARLRRDTEGMANRVELALARKGGHA